MENTLTIALSRQGGLRRQMGVVANNIANMNTLGFKAERMMFVEHLVKSRGGDNLLGRKLAYARDVATMRDDTEGPISQTGNPLDLAVRSKGYFVVQTDQGDRYTRNGRFQLDDQGQLVTQSGHPVLSDGGAPIFFAPEDDRIAISRDGTVSSRNGDLGRIAVVTIQNEQDMEPVAGALFRTDANVEPAENRDVIQGALEQSNVEAVVEMSRMIEIHRAYNGVKTMIEREDERMKKMVSELARPV